jgi:hypothetical protein
MMAAMGEEAEVPVCMEVYQLLSITDLEYKGNDAWWQPRLRRLR